jgi:hypothetical protein
MTKLEIRMTVVDPSHWRKGSTNVRMTKTESLPIARPPFLRASLRISFPPLGRIYDSHSCFVILNQLQALQNRAWSTPLRFDLVFAVGASRQSRSASNHD